MCGSSIDTRARRFSDVPHALSSHPGLTLMHHQSQLSQGLVRLASVVDRSSIEWTEATWNPTTGCDRTSPGCDHCYALTMAKRLKAMGQPRYQADGDPRTSGPGFDVALHPEALAEPL